MNELPFDNDIPLPDLPEGWEQAVVSPDDRLEEPVNHREGEPDFAGILRKYWGYDSFRGIQEDIIRSIAAGNDTLGLMPTGGGKSITFQVPALSMPGVCIVITPLIALMKDQVAHLRQRGIGAAAIYSGQSRDEILRHLENSIFGAYKFLYVSPERIATPIFQTKLQRMQVSFVTVDEAHCISQWGYDFRPSYLRIAEIRRLLPGVPVLALTATATERVITDICERLSPPDAGEGKSNFAVFRMSFARPNLRYIVRHTQDKTAELIHILRSVGGSAIVYTRSRKGTRDVCRLLTESGFTALYYHAGLTDVEKDVRQHAWQDDETRVMVATNAFGMGIDKPNVRFVIHYNMPKDLESYYQEAGRAGRDGLPSRCILLYSGTDVRTIRFFIDKEMEADNGLPADVKAEAARKAEERLKYMTFYSTTQKCLRRFMLNYFGEAAPEKCGNCSCCLFAEQNAQEVEQRAAAAKQRAAANSRRLSARRAAAGGDLSEADEKLLAALYALRKRLAAKQNVPAYMVFSDATLREMVQSKPLSMDEFLNITGVGEKKAARYGMAFLRAIEDMVGSRE